MKQFACGDVVPGCTSTFRGSESDILAAVARHATVEHGLSVIPLSLVEQVRSNIVTAG